METYYHLFRKTTKTQKKSTKKWYYYYYDDDGSRHQRVCKNCKTQNEALEFINNLEVRRKSSLTVRDVADGMFTEGSDYLNRLELLGKKICKETINSNRFYTELIIKRFGDYAFSDITAKEVVTYLVSVERSGSWKNSYCEVFSKIFDEAVWRSNSDIKKPVFPRFARNSKKADVFSSEELSLFFNSRLWNDKDIYLLYLCVATCGLRLGEARALKVSQILLEQNALVIDGFCKRDGFRTNYNKTGSNEDSKMRLVVLPELTKNLLSSYIQSRNLKNDDFVFTKDGVPFRQEYLETVFSRQLSACGIHKNGRKIVPHSLRFTYVTLMRQSLDAETVQKLVGHSSVEMTDYYTRIAIPEMAKSVQVAKIAADNLLKK